MGIEKNTNSLAIETLKKHFGAYDIQQITASLQNP